METQTIEEKEIMREKLESHTYEGIMSIIHDKQKMYDAILFEKTLQILYPKHLEGQFFEFKQYYNRHDFILNNLNEKNNNEFIFIDVKNEMFDCLDEHINEKNKIRPENVYSCIKKIKTDEFKKSLFFYHIVNNDIKKQIEKKT